MAKYYINREKYIKEGRGIGILEDYKPWLDIRSFPSKGRVTRIKGIKTGRIHTLMSDLELKYFYILEWLDNVVDIREQFPLLDTHMTFDIANKKGIKHPINTVDRTLNVFTTDFMITKKIGDNEVLIARTIKYAEDLDKPRTIELFEIEKEYWENKGIDWGIVTEKNISKTLIENIKWIHKFAELDILKSTANISDKKIDEILKVINNELYLEKNQNKKVLKFIREFDYKYNIEEGISLYLFKYGIFNKIIKINIYDIELKQNPYIRDIIK